MGQRPWVLLSRGSTSTASLRGSIPAGRRAGSGRGRGEGKALPLEPCSARIAELTHRFFRDHPGSPAIFMDVQAATDDLIAIEEEAEARLIATVLVKTIGTLLWLSATREHPLRSELVRGTPELAIA